MTRSKDKRQQPEQARRPYEPPRIVSEVVFETLALSCAGNNPTDCPGPMLSS